MNARLLVIDPQNDFCDIPGAALPVAGADADMRRLAELMKSTGARIAEVVVTLDSHASVGIERTTFWQQGNGAPVEPFMQVVESDVLQGRYLPRDAAKLLLVKPDAPLADNIVRDLPALLDRGDIIVFNDTKVIPAQLKGIRHRGEAAAAVDATLHMRVAPDRWLAFTRPAKRVQPGDRIRFDLLAGTIHVDADLESRTPEPPAPDHGRTYLADFAATTTQANAGCVSRACPPAPRRAADGG